VEGGATAGRVRRDTAGVRVPPPVFYIVGFLVGWGLNLLIGGPVVPRQAPVWERMLPAGLFGGVGVVLVVWCMVMIKRAGSNIAPMRPTTALLTGGPYRFSRNPIYVGFALIVAGAAVALNLLWPILVLVFVVMPVVRRRVVGPEEAYLERAFGREYRRYQERVPRWV
jgi:protein-S-isoprenylcysteine O-methyltransferase Ste14